MQIVGYRYFKDLEVGDVFRTHPTKGYSFIKLKDNSSDEVKKPPHLQHPNAYDLIKGHYCVFPPKMKVLCTKEITDYYDGGDCITTFKVRFD